MRTVLIVDDDKVVRNALRILLSLHDIRAVTANDPDDAIKVLAHRPVDVVIADMNFTEDTTSGQEGVELFHAIRTRHPDLPVILLTAWSHLETVVEVVKAGAADYVSKPWDDAKMLATVENLLELSENAQAATTARMSRQRRREALEQDYDMRGIVFASDDMLGVLELACRVARSAVPILITGPNGAGKERIVDLVHANSDVSGGPLIAVDCGALPDELVEAELFGAEAGAYTGATRTRIGRFDAAAGGTLFLDEIGNLAPASQRKLLRALETGEIEPLGANRTHKVKVRVISATNADIAGMVRAGTFRQDLFHRLNTIQIAVPPLSQRPDDILPLADHFLGDDGALSDTARDALLTYAWPGNVRELKNTIDRAKLLATGRMIEDADLGLPVAPVTTSGDLDDPPRAAIEAALRATHGVISQAAHRLGLSRQALYRRMERHGLSEKQAS